MKRRLGMLMVSSMPSKSLERSSRATDMMVMKRMVRRLEKMGMERRFRDMRFSLLDFKGFDLDCIDLGGEHLLGEVSYEITLLRFEG